MHSVDMSLEPPVDSRETATEGFTAIAADRVLVL